MQFFSPFILGLFRTISKWNQNSTGLNEIKHDQILNLFPNPAGSYLIIETKNDIKIKSIILIDMLGLNYKLEYDCFQNQEIQNFAINTIDIPNGVYSVIIESEGNVFARKVVINK